MAGWRGWTQAGTRGATEATSEPARPLALRSAVGAPAALEPDVGREGAVVEGAVVSRAVVETRALATLVGESSARSAERIRGEAWDTALRDAGLWPVLKAATAGRGAMATGGSPTSSFTGLLVELRQRLERVRELERRLGEAAEPEPLREQRDLDTMALLVALLGVVAALAPAWGQWALVLVLLFIAGRSGLRLLARSGSARITLDELYAARQQLAWSVRAFLSHTWVYAVGDRVVESTPHGDYFEHRLMDLDAAASARVNQVEELAGLIRGVRRANAGLGLEEEDDETRRLNNQIDGIRAQLAQIARMREQVAERRDGYLARVARLRAIATRRALSMRVSNLVTDSEDDSIEQDVAEVEVEVADLTERLRALDVDVSDADSELRAVLEVGKLDAGP